MMVDSKLIEKLIINRPYEKPSSYWKYNRETREHEKTGGRRPAGYYRATSRNPGFDDPGEFVSLGWIDEIREKVDAWRNEDYPGVTEITYELLNHWNDPSAKRNRFFFCQLEAIETLIWLTESRDASNILGKIRGDGGGFRRFCSKMATGTGKTVVMAMLIAWQVLNHSARPNDVRFANNILIMSPGIIVRNRLSVLIPGYENNYYDEYSIIPEGYFDRLNSSNIMIKTWQEMMPGKKPKYKVIKIGPESSQAFTKDNIGEIGGSLVVINDEAHHAWRLSDIGKIIPGTKEREMATKWIESLDMLNNYDDKNGTILNCYDFSATPFKSTGKIIPEDMMFNWIVSDFGLNDSIESGLTKTPRISVEDNSDTFGPDMKSRLHHIYADPDVTSNLKSNKPEKELPDLVKNAYFLLNQHWLIKKDEWNTASERKNTVSIPPVMITVCNKSKTADRIEKYLKNEFEILSTEGHFLRIDTKTLKQAETAPRIHTLDALTNEDSDDTRPNHIMMREMINTVGKIGRTGEQLWNIVAVQMLSEGWDAHNVTHIMGLRAFSSQLLCEQVVGRGLRRMSYDTDPNGFLKSEYVDIFGIPFTFLPHEADNEDAPDIGQIPTLIFADPDKSEFEMTWPNVVGIRNGLTSTIKINMAQLKPLEIYSTDVITAVGMAAVIQNKPVSKMTEIDLKDILSHKDNRLQRIIFTTAKGVFDELEQEWDTKNMHLLAQLVKTVELFIESGKIEFADLDKNEELKKKVTLLFNLGKVIRYVSEAVKRENVEYSRVILDEAREMVFTSSIRPRHTTKNTELGGKTHMNLTPYQKGWEAFTIKELDASPNVKAWIKIDQIGFKIKYYYDGGHHMYEPDFMIKMSNGVNVILEVKGQDEMRNKAKWERMNEWVEAVNAEIRFGKWEFKIAFSPEEIRGILKKYGSSKREDNTAVCPICRKNANGKKDIKVKFGYRNCQGTTRPQSWCKNCRSKSTPISTYK